MLTNAGTRSTNPGGGSLRIRLDAARTIRWIRSSIASPSVIMTALSPSGAKWALDVETHPFGGGDDAQPRAACPHRVSTGRGAGVEVIVGAFGLVMEQYECLDAGVDREIHHLVVGRMAPAAMLGVFVLGVRRVVHE